MDKNTFAENLKKKYPEYQNIDNETLVQKVVAKYPVYKSQISDFSEPVRQSFLKDTVGDFKQIGKDIIGDAQKSASILSKSSGGLTPSSKLNTSAEMTPTPGAGSTALQSVGALASAGSNTIGAAFKGALKLALPQEAEDKLKSLAATGIENAMRDPLISSVYTKAQKIYDGLDENQKANVDAAGGIASLVSEFIGVGVATKGATIAKEGISSIVDVTKSGIKNTASTTLELGSKIGKPIKSAANEIASPDKIMQRVARISKSKQASFEKTAGETVGQYLTNRGIYGNIDGISTQLYKRFEQSKNAADEALAGLTGTYEPQQVKTALTELVDREARISAPGAQSPNQVRVGELLSKFDKEGLTMSEINEVKRLYERNIKVDFIRQNLPEGIARSNNIDNAIRSWQVEQAETLGLKNLPEINRETRLAKQLLDDIGQEYAGSAGNNAISLSDWVLLSGNDPTVVGAFLTKKIFGSKGIQSFVAKTINRGKKIKGEVKADIGTSNVKQLPEGKTGLPKSQNFVPQVKMGPSSMEKGVSKTSKRLKR